MISLAVADLMVGVIIWPNMVIMQYLTFMHPRQMGTVVTKTNETLFENQNLTYRSEGGSFRNVFPDEYRLTIGFFTLLGIMVSVYTLMVASFDRFLAVYKPLTYNRFNVKRRAKVLCAAVWGICIMVSVIPTIVADMEYQVISSILITIEDDAGLVIIFVGLILPLILTWIATILTFLATKRHARSRQRMFSANTSRSQNLERRLAKTLSIMVGVFTLTVMPVICCTVAGLAAEWTAFDDPLNLNLSAATAYTTSEYLSIIILTSNSLWNCFIYSLRTRGFREAARSIMKSVTKTLGLQFIRRHVTRMALRVRRVNLCALLRLRILRSSKAFDLNKKSVSSLNTGMSQVSEVNFSYAGGPSIDTGDSSTVAPSLASNEMLSIYSQSSSKPNQVTSKVGIQTEVEEKPKNEDEQHVVEESTLESFALSVGTDRFLESITDNVSVGDEIYRSE